MTKRSREVSQSKTAYTGKPGGSTSFGERLVAYAACSILAVGWTFFAGKDIPWDALHYHVYAGYSAFNDRLTADFFPAGTQTYLNPYSYAPLYLMVRAGWPSLAVGATLAMMQSVILWMTWELARLVSQQQVGSRPRIVAWSAVILALLNPIFLQELGSSFSDMTTGALALAGYVALTGAFFGGRLILVACGGVLIGAAASLKLSNATFMLLPALPLVAGCFSGKLERVRSLVIYAACAGIGMVMVTAPWALRLDRAFGNPIFPMLDGMFHPSAIPDAVARTSDSGNSPWQMLTQLISGMRDPRFLPSSFAEALARPFAMFSSRRLVHTELVAPDLRYASLIVLAVVSGIIWTIRGRGDRAVGVIASESSRAYACLAASFVIAWVIWLSISGNSRYFIPMACIAGVLLVAGLSRLLAAVPRRMMIYALAFLLGVQIVFLWQTRDLRWGSQPWEGAWIQASIPPRLQREPQLYLPLDSQSQSFLLPWLAPGSAFLGLASGIGTDGFMGSRARALLEANSSRLRMLLLVKMIESDGRPISFDPARVDFPLRRIGLKIDSNDCELIKYKGNPLVVERSGPRSGPRDEVQLYACRVVSGGALTTTELEKRRISDRVLDAVEDECPELFGKYRRAGSSRSGTLWRRNYGDLVVWVNDDGWVRFTDLARGGGDVIGIGRVEDWIETPPKLDCRREDGRAYVMLKQVQSSSEER